MQRTGMVMFSDASFATNGDITFQLGFVAFPNETFNNPNILLNTNVKSKRVARSVRAAEPFAEIFVLDYASTLRVLLLKSFLITSFQIVFQHIQSHCTILL